MSFFRVMGQRVVALQRENSVDEEMVGSFLFGGVVQEVFVAGFVCSGGCAG